MNTRHGRAQGTLNETVKLHATLNRNFQLLPAAKWLALLFASIPATHVRY